MSRLRRSRPLYRESWCAALVPMQRLPQADLRQGRNHIRLQQAAAAHLVQGYLSPHAIQEGHLQHRTGSPARRHPDRSLGHETQARASHARAQREQAIERRRPNGRRLHRRRSSWPARTGAKGKTPFVAAVATTGDGKPNQIILRPVKAFSLVAIRKLAATALARDAQVLTDGLACFAAVADVGCTHAAIKTGAGPRAAKTPAFKWVNTALGNIKAALVGTYRAVRSKHVPRYLAEFEYRFNRRYDLSSMIPRLAFVALRTAPMPYRLLKLADVAA